MSEGKSGAPVDISPSPDGGGAGDAIGSVAGTATLAVVGLATIAAVGVGKGAAATYRHVRRSMKESSQTAKEVWISEMMASSQANGGDSTSMSGTLSGVGVTGVRLDAVFDRIGEMNKKNTAYINSLGFNVTDYTFSDSTDRVVVMEALGQAGSGIAFVKDVAGEYNAFKSDTDSERLGTDITDVASLFYRNDLYHQLDEWGFTDISGEQSAGAFELTATNSDKEKIKVGINRSNGQVNFDGIPVSVREKVKAWLERFTECRVTRSGNLKGTGVGKKMGGRTST